MYWKVNIDSAEVHSYGAMVESVPKAAGLHERDRRESEGIEWMSTIAFDEKDVSCGEWED